MAAGPPARAQGDTWGPSRAVRESLQGDPAAHFSQSKGAARRFAVLRLDGGGPRPPVTVLCGVRGGEAVTALTHDTEDKTKVDGFQSPGSFAQSIHYQVTSLTQCNNVTLVNKS